MPKISRKELEKKMSYDVYPVNDNLEIVAIIQANSEKEAEEKALKMGFGKGYIVLESWDD